MTKLVFVERSMLMPCAAVRQVDHDLEFNNLVGPTKCGEARGARDLMYLDPAAGNAERKPANRVEKEAGGLAADEGLHRSTLGALAMAFG